jgi:hypothetical protein
LAKSQFKLPDNNPFSTAELRAAAVNRGGVLNSDPTSGKVSDDNSKNEQLDSPESQGVSSGSEMYASSIGKKDKSQSQSQSAKQKRRPFSVEESNGIRQIQRQRKKLLAECEPVLNVNYEWLSMNDYPENRLLALARRNRDFWLVGCLVFLLGFLGGVYDLFPSWFAGSCFGLLVVFLSFSLSPIRRLFFKFETLGELLEERKDQEFKALHHIRHLEGRDGLAWRCAKLSEYNGNLNRKIFKGLYKVSGKRTLFNVIRERKHIRLYLLLMIESEKAYKRLTDAYLKTHFSNLENGFDDGSPMELDSLKTHNPES